MIIRWFGLGGELSPLDGWKKTVGYDADNDIVYVPAAIVGREMVIEFMCEVSGITTAKCDGHLFVPSDFVTSTTPDRLSQRAVDNIRSVLKQKMEECDAEPV